MDEKTRYFVKLIEEFGHGISDFEWDVEELERSGILNFVDSHFNRTNSYLRKMPLEARRRAIDILLEEPITKLRMKGYHNEQDIDGIAEIIKQNWLMVIDLGKKNISSQQLLELGIESWKKHRQEMAEEADSKRKSAKRRARLVSGASRLVTGGGLIIGDTLALALTSARPTSASIIASIWGGAVLYFQGLDKIVE